MSENDSHDDALDILKYSLGRGSGKSILSTEMLKQSISDILAYTLEEQQEALEKLACEYPDTDPEKIWKMFSNEDKQQYIEEMRTNKIKKGIHNVLKEIDVQTFNAIKQGTNITYGGAT